MFSLPYLLATRRSVCSLVHKLIIRICKLNVCCRYAAMLFGRFVIQDMLLEVCFHGSKSVMLSYQVRSLTLTLADTYTGIYQWMWALNFWPVLLTMWCVRDVLPARAVVIKYALIGGSMVCLICSWFYWHFDWTFDYQFDSDWDFD